MSNTHPILSPKNFKKLPKACLGSLFLIMTSQITPHLIASNLETIEVEAQQNLFRLIKRYNAINPKTGESYAAGLVEDLRNATSPYDSRELKERVFQLWLYGLDLRSAMRLPDGTMGTIGNILSQINIRIDQYLQQIDPEHAKDFQWFFEDLKSLKYNVLKDPETRQTIGIEPQNVELYDVIGDFQDFFRDYYSNSIRTPIQL